MGSFTQNNGCNNRKLWHHHLAPIRVNITKFTDSPRHEVLTKMLHRCGWWRHHVFFNRDTYHTQTVNGSIYTTITSMKAVWRPHFLHQQLPPGITQVLGISFAASIVWLAAPQAKKCLDRGRLFCSWWTIVRKFGQKQGCIILQWHVSHI